MLYEDLRSIHEDNERLELAIAERNLENPRKIRKQLARDHEIAYFSARIQKQSERGLQIYNDQKDARMQELQTMSTGDNNIKFEQFYKQLASIKEFHKRNPNETVENLETAYKRPEKGGPLAGFAGDMNSMFTGEEHFGKFFDLILMHDEYNNLPGIRGGRPTTYLHYLDTFDQFTAPQCPVTKQDKMTEQYFNYVSNLSGYIESFMRKTRPSEELDRVFAQFDAEFDKDWEADKVPGWEPESTTNGAENGIATQGTGEGVWCSDCDKEFSNDNTYKAHLSGKKHIKNAQAKKTQPNGDVKSNSAEVSKTVHRLKEKAIAEREYRVRKLAGAMQTVRAATREEVPRRFGLTERERQNEIEDELASDDEDYNMDDDKPEEEDEEEKIYNPLKLPLAWDGKPIPFWLYKLHGLGTEYTCEICGNFVYMGRRAYEKHFSESRHQYGLKCLGIQGTGTGLFREITKIAEAELLWNKLQQNKKTKVERDDDIIEMEDSSGTLMPKSIYDDLLAEGLL